MRCNSVLYIVVKRKISILSYSLQKSVFKFSILIIALLFSNIFVEGMEGMNMPSTTTGGVKENPANDPNDICHKYSSCVNCTLAEEGILEISNNKKRLQLVFQWNGHKLLHQFEIRSRRSLRYVRMLD